MGRQSKSSTKFNPDAVERFMSGCVAYAARILVKAFLLLSMLSFQVGKSFADVGYIYGDASWVTTAIVTKIDSNGRFEMNDGIEIQYRLWGVLPKQGFVSYLKENILGKQLVCVHAGHSKYTGRRPSPLKPLTNTLVCQRPGVHSPFPGGLAGELFETGVAEPFCPEAFSFVPDCMESIQ